LKRDDGQATESSRRKPADQNPEMMECCDRCGGTGLVCGHTPVIAPGCSCVDYANAVCPDCKGRGGKESPRRQTLESADTMETNESDATSRNPVPPRSF